MQAFSREMPEVGPRDLSRSLGASPAVVERMLATLEARGFLERGQSSVKYRLGPAVLPLAETYSRLNRFSEIALRTMREIRDEVDETVCLHVYSALRRITVLQVESRQELRFIVDLGRRYPLHKGAAGKVLLGFLPTDLLEAVLADTFGPEWRHDAACSDLLGDLEAVRAQGWAVTRGEREPGGVGIAVPVFTSAYAQTACLSIYAPSVRMGEDRAKTCLGLLAGASERLSDQGTRLPQD